MLFKNLEQIKRTLNTYLSIEATVTVSKIQNGYDNLIKMYDKCVEVIKYKFILNTGLIIRSEFINKDELQNIKIKN